MAIGDSFDQFEMLIREKLDSKVEDLEVHPTDILWDIIQTMRNVKKLGRNTSSGGGPGYEANWNVRVQEGGRMTGRSFGETEITKMNTNLVMGMAASSQGLDPVDTPQRSFLKLTSYLRKASGQITMNRDQMEADLISDPVEKVAAGYIEDATKQVRGLVTALGWGNGDGAMGQVDTSTAYTIAEGAITWLAIKSGSIFRFKRGQRYVFAATTTVKFDTPRTGTGASAKTPSYARCVGVNPRTLRVGFESEAGQGTITTVVGDYIIYQGMWDFTQTATSATDNTPSLAPNGIESLLPEVSGSNTYPDTTHVLANWPELQAFIFGDDTAPEVPDGSLIDDMLDYMTSPEADNLGAPPMLIAERSIWSLWRKLEKEAYGMVVFNQTYQAGGGSSGPLYTHGDKQFIPLTSSMCRAGWIYGLDPASFIKFFPTDLTIRWAMSQGGMAGMGNIFRPITNGRCLTDLSAADFDMWWQFAQTRPNANCIRKGVYSRRTYSS